VIYILRRALRDLTTWPRTLQLALVLAISLILILGIAVVVVPYELRIYACIGVFGSVLVVQAALLIGYREMVKPLAKAQRAYLASDFETACQVLQPVRESGNADVRSLTLLGNTYRQLGDLDASRQVLYEAVHKSPEDQYPLYGFGRTLLAAGEFGQAGEMLERALQQGAPVAVRLDLAEAVFFAGDVAGAGAIAQSVDADFAPGEAYREFLRVALSWKAGIGSLPLPDHEGRAYWDLTARRFSHTPYGVAVKRLLDEIEGAWAE
jgi:tetratricopeptide (TPR) repeat protein